MKGHRRDNNLNQGVTAVIAIRYGDSFGLVEYQSLQKLLVVNHRLGTTYGVTSRQTRRVSQGKPILRENRQLDLYT